MSKDLRPLDHLVLPVADLSVAEQRYKALGFTVAPRGQHPFGTANACIYFEDGSFLEPLAVADAAIADAAAKAGNVFVSHDATFRIRAGAEGVSALVLGTRDAKADDARFRAESISAGEMLRFSRPFAGADGSSGEASFLLAFATDLRAPDALFFTCERVGVPAVDRSPLIRHANGTQAIGRVILVAPEPHHFETLLCQLMDHAEPKRRPEGFDLKTSTAMISVITREAAAALLGGAIRDEDPTMQFAGIEFGVTSLAATIDLLHRNQVPFEKIEQAVLVCPAPGQGVPFIFKESHS